LQRNTSGIAATVLEQWRRVRRESSRPKLASSPSLPFCNGDLQNQTKTQHRQSILVVFFFVLFFKIGSRVLPVFSNLPVSLPPL
jgi:hypothetical protein